MNRILVLNDGQEYWEHPEMYPIFRVQENPEFRKWVHTFNSDPLAEVRTTFGMLIYLEEHEATLEEIEEAELALTKAARSFLRSWEDRHTTDLVVG